MELYFVFNYKETSLFEMVLTICVVSFLLDKICTGHVPGRPSYLLRPRRGFGLQMFPVCHVQFSHRNNKMSLVRSW